MSEISNTRRRATGPSQEKKKGLSRPGSARKKLTQPERTALSDRRMFDAAIELINERGTHKTTLKDVGERAGYSRGLASNRFGSKDALFFELLKQFNRRWKESAAAAVGLRAGLDALRAANIGLIGFFESESVYIRVMYMIWYEMIGSSELMRKQLADQHEAYRHGIARWIREAIAEGEIKANVSPESVAVQYSSVVFGLIYQWLVHPESIDIVQGLHDLRENIFAIVRL